VFGAGGISVLELRLDGFSSIGTSGVWAGGEFTTRTISFAGDQLKLNLVADIGAWIRIEVIDGASSPEAPIPIAGFGLNESVPLSGNQLRATVVWLGQPADALGRLAGRPVRVRFVMRGKCDLYSFQFLSSHL
jgi:hypothetical protein